MLMLYKDAVFKYTKISVKSHSYTFYSSNKYDFSIHMQFLSDSLDLIFSSVHTHSVKVNCHPNNFHNCYIIMISESQGINVTLGVYFLPTIGVILYYTKVKRQNYQSGSQINVALLLSLKHTIIP